VCDFVCEFMGLVDEWGGFESDVSEDWWKMEGGND
jgi:hypothetical protein